MRILVAGAGGQLGRSIPAAFASDDVTMCTHGDLDITDLVAVRKKLDSARPELVINAAAWNRVDDAETMVHDAFRVNATGPRNLALAAAENGTPIIHVSTDYVFDGTRSAPYVESDTPCPQSVYGASKLAGEEAVRSANPRHHIVRTAWVFHEEGANFPNTMLRLANQGTVRVVDDQVGSPTYAPHLAEALASVASSVEFGTWHLTGAGQCSWYDLTYALFENLGIDTALEAVSSDAFPRPAKRPAFSVLATERKPAILLPPWQTGLEVFCSNLPG